MVSKPNWNGNGEKEWNWNVQERNGNERIIEYKYISFINIFYLLRFESELRIIL